MDKKKQVFLYLDDLERSGYLPMWGSTPYIMETFSLPPHRAIEILKEWIQMRSKRIPHD